jgi:hypothetical protein
MTTTTEGCAAVTEWLQLPVAHVRDVRSELLAKLGLLVRRGVAPSALITAQRSAFAPMEQALERRLASETDFGAILARWRVENVRAALRFLDEVAAATSAH